MRFDSKNHLSFPREGKQFERKRETERLRRERKNQ